MFAKDSIGEHLYCSGAGAEAADIPEMTPLADRVLVKVAQQSCSC
jgi:hypothetical protein